MESDQIKQSKSDLNYLITNYLESGINLKKNEKDKENLLNIAKSNFDYGQLFDIDLNSHSCNYEIKKEVFSRLNDLKLDEIYNNYLLGNNFIQKSDGGKNFSNLNTNSNFFQKIRKLKLGDNQPLSQQKKPINLKYYHMKSILGHIQIQDSNLINPVAIYCVCYSNNGELFFTGDNNGLIKIWSSKTGAMVETFKDHEKAINDLLVINDYLISCSDDMSVKIWDTVKLELVKSLQFDECIVKVISYETKIIISKTSMTKKINVIIASSNSGKNYLFDESSLCFQSKLKDNLDGEEEDNLNFFNISKFYFDKKIVEKCNLKGQRNSLILNSSAVGKKGLQIIGFNNGLICVWDIDKIVDDIYNKKKQLYDYEKYLLFLEFVHNDVTHFLEFNKNNTEFLTGSLDGNILVWKINDEIISKMRKGLQTTNKNDKDYIYPVFVSKKINEDEKLKTKCSVSACCWTSNFNYIICLISSKNKKKITPLLVSNNLNANSANNTYSNNNINCQNNKRSSAMLVYDTHKEVVIKRLDEDNNFNFHDECYVLEPHPKYDDIVLTVLNTSDVIILNFLTNEVLCKFREENYFFNNVPTNMITTEGKFSSQGDMFVVSTYLGSVSIYSIYSKTSYSGTYMNQFFEDENIKSSNMIYPKFSNMFMLPYVIQQPYSKYKIESFNQTNKDNFSVMQKSYYYDFDYNFNERHYECLREEKIFIEAAKENLTYRLQDQSERDENNSDNDELENYNNDPRDESFVGVPDEEMEYEEFKSLGNDELLDQEEIDEESGSYNLRSKKKKEKREEEENRRKKFRNPRSNNNIIESDFMDDEENVIIENDHLAIEEEDKNIIDNYTTNQTSGRSLRSRKNNILLNVNEALIQNKKRLVRRRLKKIKSEINPNYELDNNINFQEDCQNLNNSSEKDKEISFNNLDEKQLLILIEECKDIEDFCFICKKRSKNLIGPVNIKATNNSKEYIHLDCIINYNDFQIYNPSNTINIEKTLEEIIDRNLRCFRCNAENATKKCSNADCDRYFHGNYCLNKFCVEYKNSIFCLECFKNISFSKSKPLMKEEKNHYNFLYRNFLTKNIHSFYTYFPQINDKVYFILQAYEDFLRMNFESIIYEIDSIFFWKKSRIIKDNCTFECEIVNIEYSFPNDMTVSLIQKSYKKEIYERLKLIIKLELKIINDYESVNEDNIIKIIFFENNLPDFLINKASYETNLKLLKKQNKEQVNYFDIVMADGIFKSKLLGEEPRENSEFYNKSPFEMLIFTSDFNDDVDHKIIESENTFRVSFWDIQNNNIKKDPTFLMSCMELKSRIEEFYSKNEKNYFYFYDTVDEKRDQAENYYTFIPVSIGLKLVIERLAMGYYNNFASIEFDVDLILKNSIKFNGDKSKISNLCKKMVLETKNLIEEFSRKDLDKIILNIKDLPEDTVSSVKLKNSLNGETSQNIKMDNTFTNKKKRLLSQIQSTNEIVEFDKNINHKKHLRSSSRRDNIKSIKNYKYQDIENKNESIQEIENDIANQNIENSSEFLMKKRSKRYKKN